ncbi:Imm6 family immunity protein [Bacillus manliponensis]
MDFINKLNTEGKVAVGLVIAENMFKIISKEEDGYKIGREALDSCWKWLEGEKIEADNLCNYIDSEDYVDVAECANKETDVQKQYAWYAVLDAVSYTTYQAYHKEERKYVPQVVEIIDDETLIILGENAIESSYFKMENLEVLKKHLLKNYSLRNSNKSFNYIKRESLPLT